ncbi:MAG: 4Fe-4S dicluster domain-containing protein [Limisphaerales bacterium]
MQSNRRGFIKRGLLTAGAALAGSGAVEHQHMEDHVPAPGSSPTDPTTPALTPDGQLVQVTLGHDAAAHPHLPPGDPAIRIGSPGRKWIMVIDLAKCDGCKKCTASCNQMHNTPVIREWIKVFQMRDAQHSAPYWFPKPCFHCDNPPCTKVCPVGATFKRQDGIVLIDNTRCIGCRFCMAACPYSTRFFNWGRPQNEPGEDDQSYSPETGHPRRLGTVEKCDFCPDMAARGELPACVKNCAMGALHYGDENEDAVTNSKGETERLSVLLRERAGYRYLEELGTEPRVFYLPPKNRIYPAPGEEKQPNHEH